jgi:hypothetical protein
MGQVYVKVTQERWDKTRKMVHDIWQEYSDRQTEFPVEVLGEDSAGGLNHNQLERRKGFLVYVVQAYPSLVPYLKGIHLTLNSWRSGRNEDGWKQTRADMEHLRRNGCPEETMKSLSDEAPRLVMPVPRLEQDLKSLLALTDPLVPLNEPLDPSTYFKSVMGLEMPVGKVLGASYFWMVLWNGSRGHGKNSTRQNRPIDENLRTWSSVSNHLQNLTAVPILKYSCVTTAM